jgi:hypothetical protein
MSTKLYMGGLEIKSQEELDQAMAKIGPMVSSSTLKTLEVVGGLHDLVAAISAGKQPQSLAEVDMPAGLLIWDCISVIGLTDFALEILGPDLYGKIQQQIGSEDETQQQQNNVLPVLQQGRDRGRAHLQVS